MSNKKSLSNFEFSVNPTQPFGVPFGFLHPALLLHQQHQAQQQSILLQQLQLKQRQQQVAAMQHTKLDQEIKQELTAKSNKREKSVNRLSTGPPSGKTSLISIRPCKVMGA